MFQATTGSAASSSGEDAVTQAITLARLKLRSQPNIAIVFASSTFNQRQVLTSARAVLGPTVDVVGASTAGEISQAGPSHSPSVVVMLLSSDTAVFTTAAVANASGREDEAGAELAHALKNIDADDPKILLIFSDGLTVNPNGILRGIKTVLPTTQIAGGSAGDDGAFKQTFQYHNDDLLSSGVSAIAIRGNVEFSFGVRHGWSPISGPRTVTKAEGSVIKEIDHKPAIKLYEEFLGSDEAEKLKEVTLAELALSYPLGIVHFASNEMLLRAPLYVHDDGSITCGGEVAEGTQVQLMMGAKDLAIEAAGQSAAEALSALTSRPAAAILFSCHVRDTLFASRDEAKLEINAIQAKIGSEVPLIGFYTYAEQAPMYQENGDLKSCDSLTHNETIVSVLLTEKIYG